MRHLSGLQTPALRPCARHCPATSSPSVMVHARRAHAHEHTASREAEARAAAWRRGTSTWGSPLSQPARAPLIHGNAEACPRRSSERCSPGRSGCGCAVTHILNALGYIRKNNDMSWQASALGWTSGALADCSWPWVRCAPSRYIFKNFGGGSRGPLTSGIVCICLANRCARRNKLPGQLRSGSGAARSRSLMISTPCCALCSPRAPCPPAPRALPGDGGCWPHRARRPPRLGQPSGPPL